MNPALPINEAEVQGIVDGITDPIVRNLVTLGIAEMRQRFGRPVGETEGEWLARLPAAPVDMRFYAEVLRSLFRDTELIRAILAGKSIAAASGWDV